MKIWIKSNSEVTGEAIRSQSELPKLSQGSVLNPGEVFAEIPESVQKHLEAGNIDADDLNAAIIEWSDADEGDLYLDSSNFEYVDIINLTPEHCTFLRNNLQDWLHDYGEELDEEYELEE